MSLWTVFRSGHPAASARIRRTPLAVTAAASALVLLSACDVSGAASTAETEGASDAADADSGAVSGEVNLYTSEPEAKIQEIITAFNEQYPDVDVEVFRAGTGELKTRIATEKQSGTIGADVLLAADVPTFETYAAEGDLAALDGVDLEGVEEEQIDAENMYVGTRIIPTVIAYNTNEVTEAPTTWAELADPQYKDRLVMPNPEVSGAAAFNAAVWLSQPELGEQWMTDLAANNPTIVESNGPVSQNVANATQPIGVVVDYLVRDLAAEGSPIAVSYPTDGVPYVNQPAGIFEDSDNPEAAAAFVAFLVSPEGQEIAVEQNYVPVRGDVGTPDGAPALEDLALVTPDYEKITAEQDAAVATFTELFT